MATRKQRSRKHERRVQHQLVQRARLRAALDTAPAAFTTPEMRKHMDRCGYYPDLKGRWRRLQAGLTDALAPVPRGPSWAGILSRRKRKRKG